MKLNHRKPIRRTWRTTIRRANRSCLRVRWRAPDDLGQSITAFRRALRAHRRLAKLAPRFFDEGVVRREAHNDAERRRRTAILEPILARVYGVEPSIPAATHELPPLPSLRTQHAVEQQLAAVQLWMEIGQSAMDRHQQRHPHAVPNFNQVIRLIELAIDCKKRVLGLDSPNPLPDKITYDNDWPDLKRAYGRQTVSSLSVKPGKESTAAPASVPNAMPDLDTKPPPDTKRDITPVKLVRGPHGLLMYEYPKPASGP